MDLGKLKWKQGLLCIIILFTECLDGRSIKKTKNLLKFCNLPYDYPVDDAMYFYDTLHCCNCPIGQEVEEHCEKNNPLSTKCRNIQIQFSEPPSTSPNDFVTADYITYIPKQCLCRSANNSLDGESEMKTFLYDIICPDNSWKDIMHYLYISIGFNVVLVAVVVFFIVVVVFLRWKHMSDWCRKKYDSIGIGRSMKKQEVTSASPNESNGTIVVTPLNRRSLSNRDDESNSGIGSTLRQRISSSSSSDN